MCVLHAYIYIYIYIYKYIQWVQCHLKHIYDHRPCTPVYVLKCKSAFKVANAKHYIRGIKIKNSHVTLYWHFEAILRLLKLVTHTETAWFSKKPCSYELTSSIFQTRQDYTKPPTISKRTLILKITLPWAFLRIYLISEDRPNQILLHEDVVMQYSQTCKWCDSDQDNFENPISISERRMKIKLKKSKNSFKYP